MQPLPPRIFGTTTVNEKGQIVIPADARNSVGLEPGTKLLVLSGPDSQTLVLVTAKHAEEMLSTLTTHIRNLNDDLSNNNGDAA